MSAELKKQMAYTDGLCLAFKYELKIPNVINMHLSTANNRYTQSPVTFRKNVGGSTRHCDVFILHLHQDVSTELGRCDLHKWRMEDLGALSLPPSRCQGSSGPGVLPSSPGPLHPFQETFSTPKASNWVSMPLSSF